MTQKSFRFRQVQLIIFICVTMTIFTNCGSSSNSDQPSPHIAVTTYQLYNPLLLEPGFKETATLEGRDSNGGIYTGTYETETLPAVVLEGHTVIPIVTTLNLTQTSTNDTSTSLETTYLVDINTPFRKTSGPVTYEPGAISPLPASGVFGDQGVITSWSGNDGTRISGTWGIEDAGGGFANIVESSTTEDVATNTILQTQEQILTIDESGNSKTISFIITIPAQNFSYTLSGDFN